MAEQGGVKCLNIPETVIHMKIIRESTFLITGKTHMLREIQSDSLKLYQKEEKKRE